MSNLIDQVRAAQILAAEEVVVKSLRDKGLLFDEPATEAIALAKTPLGLEVLSALDSIRLVTKQQMGVAGLEATFVGLVEALEPDRPIDTDWRCRLQNAVDRYSSLSSEMSKDYED